MLVDGSARPSVLSEKGYLGPTIRGTALIPLQPFIEGRFGTSSWAAFLHQLPEETRDIYERPLIASVAYPLSAALDAIDSLVRLAGGGSTLREFAVFNLDFATKMVFRAIFKLGSPEFMVARSDQVWRKLYSHGRMSCATSRGRAIVQLHGFQGLRPNYDRLLLHSVEAVLIKAGAKMRGAEQVRCILRGDPCCELSYVWT